MNTTKSNFIRLVFRGNSILLNKFSLKFKIFNYVQFLATGVSGVTVFCFQQIIDLNWLLNILLQSSRTKKLQEVYTMLSIANILCNICHETDSVTL